MLWKAIMVAHTADAAVAVTAAAAVTAAPVAVSAAATAAWETHLVVVRYDAHAHSPFVCC